MFAQANEEWRHLVEQNECGFLTDNPRPRRWPKETTDLLDGFFGSGFADANAAYEQVKDDVGLLIDGVLALLRSYQGLDEPSVAREALGRLLDAANKRAYPMESAKRDYFPIRRRVWHRSSTSVHFSMALPKWTRSCSGLTNRTGPLLPWTSNPRSC